MFAFGIIKTFGPYFAIALIGAFIWFQGYNTADKKRIEYIAKVNAESEAVKKRAEEVIKAQALQIEQTKKQIEDTSNANRAVIDAITSRNSTLVERVRERTRSCFNALPDHTSTASTSDATTTSSGEFWQSLVDSARSADEVTETARAAQAYIQSLGVYNVRN